MAVRRMPALGAALFLAGCGSAEPERRLLRVFAASSLTEAFGDMAGAFETSHPDTEVVLAFAGS